MMKRTDAFRVMDAVPDTPAGFRTALERALQAAAGSEQKRSAGARGPRRRRSRRMAVVLAAALVLLLSGAALAVGLLLTGGGSKIGFFERVDDAELRAKQDYYERASDAVAAPLVTGDAAAGATLTIDNIAIHGEHVAVFYTVRADEALPETVEPPAPYLAVNGGVRIWGRAPDVTMQRVDAHTLACMLDFSVIDPLPKTCTLTVGIEALFGVSGDWQQTFQVDLTKADAEARVALSRQTVRLKGTQGAGIGPYHDHEITIASVTMDKNGGVLLLEEQSPGDAIFQNEAFAAWWARLQQAKADYLAANPGRGTIDWEGEPLEAFLAADPEPLTMEEKMDLLNSSVDEVSFMPFVAFAVCNDRGASLNARVEGITGSGAPGPVQNPVYFTPDFDTRYLRLIPILGADGEGTANLRFDAPNTPIEVYPGFTVTLTNAVTDESARTVTFSYREEGVRSIYGSSPRVTDAAGAVIEIEDHGSMSSPEIPFRDDATGVYTETLAFYDGDFDLSRVHGVMLRYEIPVLDEENAVTIHLK